MATFSSVLHSFANQAPSLTSRILVVSLVAVLATCLAIYLGAFNGWSLAAVGAIVASIVAVAGGMQATARLLGQ